VHLHVQEAIRARRAMAELINRQGRRRSRVRKNAPLPPFQQPDHLRMTYFSSLRNMLVRAKTLIDSRLTHRLQLISAEVASKARRDAGVRDVPGLVADVEDAFWNDYSDASVERLAETTARQTSDFQRDQLSRHLTAAVGVNVPIRDGNLGEQVDRFTAWNVSLIRTIPQRYFDQVRSTIVEDVSDGRRWEDISDDLEERFDVAESTAKLIARDQVGKFYGALNEERQTELGIESFIWRTMNDNRVREEHEDLAGDTFPWDDPPAEGIPGEPINCRCYAEPDLSAILEDL
jgi:SPP1 gp7 family putative phage head morphogenesis protein